MPLNNWVNFSNPVLRREVRGAFRFRRSKAWQGITQTFFAAIIFGALILIFLNVLYLGGDRRETWEFFTNVGLFLLIASSALWSAKSFTRERENGMSESIGLSLMSPWEIVSAKLFAPLLTLGIYSVPVWLTLLPCIQWFNATSENYNTPPTVSQALCAFSVLCATTWFVVSFGLYISHWHSRTTNAVITVIVVLLILWAVMPIFINPFASVFLGFSPGAASDSILQSTNPFVALNEIGRMSYISDPSGNISGSGSYVSISPVQSWLFVLFAFVSGSAFLLLLVARLKRSFPQARRALNSLVEPAHEPDSVA
jgi:ABC-type transport system involved in multi-copper enzyme maturation permease subunit